MDFITDNNAFGIEHVKNILSKDNKLPEYVSDEVNDMSKFASSAFADEANREYPINTKENTWKSIAYFYTQGISKVASEAKKQEIEHSLYLASVVHNIKEDAKNIISSISNNIKTASNSNSEKEYGIIRNNIGYLPINNSFEVIESAKELDKDYLKLEPTLAKTAAIKIVNKAEALGIATREYLPASILESGTERLFDYDYAKKIASERADKTGCDVYLDLVESANNDYKKDNESLLKYASEFYKLDRAFGVNNYGDYGVQDPCEIFFSGVKKSAADKFASENVLFNDIFIPLSEFKSDTFKENITNYFSKKTASEILDSCKGDAIDIKIALDKLEDKTKLDLLKVLALS